MTLIYVFLFFRLIDILQAGDGDHFRAGVIFFGWRKIDPGLVCNGIVERISVFDFLKKLLFSSAFNSVDSAILFNEAFDFGEGKSIIIGASLELEKIVSLEYVFEEVGLR